MSLRDRKRLAVQRDITDVAVDLFLANGYEATTVGQIAEAAGLSPRSFFRYFDTKEAVITHMLDAAGVGIADHLSTRPSEERAWHALRRSFDHLVEMMDSGYRALQWMRLIYETPSLYADYLLKQAQWNQLIADALALRLTAVPPGEERRLSAGALAAVAVSCFEIARVEWVGYDGRRTLADLLDVTMNSVSELS